MRSLLTLAVLAAVTFIATGCNNYGCCDPCCPRERCCKPVCCERPCCPAPRGPCCD